MTLTLLFVFLAVLGVVSAGPEADRITSLPGWRGELPSAQFSGFLKVSGGSNMHYWFVESETAPENAPTVLWLNGGPGCSSLDGFIYEMGPFVVNKDLTLTPREYRWNKMVNMLYIEAPVGVGFSYSDNSNYKCDDDRTALESMQAVEKFFELFPEHNTKDSSFYITGESYGGVYVPTLAESIVKATLDNKYTGAKLKGIAVGNGCSGNEVGICGNGPQGTFYEWQYLIQTSFVSNKLKKKVNSACDWEAAEANVKNSLSAKCIDLLNQASNQIQNVNMYDIYGDCVNDSGCNGKNELNTYYTNELGESKPRGKVPERSTQTYIDNKTGKKHTLGARLVSHGPNACIDSKMASAYLNQDSVQAAIHVDIKNNGQTCWSVCGSAPGWSYNSTRTNLPVNTYPLLVSNIRVTIYNGDWDACVPYTDGEGWTSGMGLPVKNDWHSWSYTSTDGNANQVGGYATEYDVSNMGTGSFEFIVVKGGRHEVPETAPGQAYEMLKRVVNGEAF
jgi:serine carboxypeptidase-like clade I